MERWQRTKAFLCHSSRDSQKDREFNQAKTVKTHGNISVMLAHVQLKSFYWLSTHGRHSHEEMYQALCDLYFQATWPSLMSRCPSLPLSKKNPTFMYYNSPEGVMIMVAMPTIINVHTIYTLYRKGLKIWISFPCFKSCRAINRPMFGSPPPPHPRIPVPMARHSTS